MLVDSHCHLDQLDLKDFDNNLNTAIQYQFQKDLQHLLCVCITLKDFPAMMKIVHAYEQVSGTVGLHPNETDIDKEPSIEDLIHLAQEKKVVGIGETGLDYYRSSGDVEWQRNRFRNHIAAALETKKPLIIHSRQAKIDTLNIMREENARDIGGVMHCFTEDYEMAKKALDLNFYISFSGIITFNNAEAIRETAKKIPLDRILIETDSPYLAPIPFRGKSNQPAYVRYVAEMIATLRGDAFKNIAEQTTHNFYNLFKIKL